jgi:hypothetical protein
MRLDARGFSSGFPQWIERCLSDDAGPRRELWSHEDRSSPPERAATWPASYALSATTVLRRELGVWKAVHRYHEG